MEDLLTCSVCLRKYDDPRVLPCQHTFCLKPCLEKLFDVNFRQIKCPLCRFVHCFAKGYITSLPKNFTIRSIMDMSIDKTEKIDQLCPLCNALISDLSKCECCSKCICKSCYKIHINKTKENLQALSNNLKKTLSTEKEKFRKLLSDISYMESGKQKLILDINQSFNDMLTVLKERKTELLDAVRTKFQPRINGLKSLEETMEINVAVLSSSILSAADSLVKDNVSHGHLLALLNSIQTTLPDKSQSTPENISNLDMGEFSSDTTNIKNLINNFGHLKWSNSEKPPSPPTNSNKHERTEQSGNEILNNVERSNCENTREKTYIIERPCKSIAYEIPVSVKQLLPITLQSIYMTKSLPILTFGSKGTGSGEFIWPRGIAIDSSTNRIIIADSSNHRVQIFSDKGVCEKVIPEMVCDQGTDDNVQLKFDCLSGIAIDKNKRIICSDRYHHRVAIMDIDGKLICEIGKSSNNKAKLSYPWGIATDSRQNIFICDKDNHRIQVFSNNGEYIKEIGAHGQQCGMFDNPHYLAVCPKTKNIFVSDTSNHRIQVFDKHGTYLYSFNGDGPTKFHLKYPRGITVDNEGNVLICDYGNNRISIFSNQGKFLYLFGSHGSHDGQFKGLEGIAVFNDGRIAVSDRDNHRIQIF